nr:MAG: putative RNA-dependent RNA polymerase [Partitiviridae sp.]
MAATITVKRNANAILPAWAPYTISSFQYPEHVEVDNDEVQILDGTILPDGEGFGFRMEPPSVSFKVYRAMVNHGLSDVANQVLRTKKRSFITPNAIWNGVLKFAGKPPKRMTGSEYSAALESIRAELRVNEKIIPYTMDEGVKTLPQNTSPGLPFITRAKGMKKGAVYEKYARGFKNHWNRVGKGLPTAPLPDCAAFARSHISSPDVNKVRPVWAYPMMAVCEESRFAAPLIKELTNQRVGLHTAYGCEMMKGGMTWINGHCTVASARYPGTRYLMTDYSGFDSTVPAWIIRDIFNVLEQKMDFSKVTDGVNTFDVNPEEERRKFRKLVSYFINTTIQNCDGRRFQKAHGVPSGSMFTNIIDTFVNMLLSRVLVTVCSQCEPVFDVYFGDDGLIAIPPEGLIDMRKYRAAAKELFGMVLNAKKSYFTTTISNVHFLGYYNYYGSPYKQSAEMIASMLYPQYLKDDWAYCVSRALGCALASAGMSTDVYLASQAVYLFATRRERKFEEGMELMLHNPRIRRHLIQMGCGDIPLNEKYFRDINSLVPRLDCQKLVSGIQLVK